MERQKGPVRQATTFSLASSRTPRRSNFSLGSAGETEQTEGQVWVRRNILRHLGSGWRQSMSA